jgi:hypothetical protein
MKIKLREVSFWFHHTLPGGGWHQFVVHAGLLNGALSLSFTISGTDETRENLPASLVDAIREGLAYAQRNVNVKDLREMDPPESDE